MTKIAISIASDHGGYPLKKNLIKIIQDEGYNVIDKGAYNYDPEDDYPDFAKLVLNPSNQVKLIKELFYVVLE